MSGITPILLVLLGAAVAVAFFQLQRNSKLTDAISDAESTAEEKRAEAEKARKEMRARRDELERTRKELQDAKSKLKKHAKKSGTKDKGKSKDAPIVASEESAVAAVVRVTNAEVEAKHALQVTTLEARIAELESENRTLEDKAQRSEADAKRAADRLDKMSKPASPAQPEDEQTLQTQLEALRRASNERTTDLKTKVKKLKGEVRREERRAASNHQLYQVAKGQLAVIEARMAKLKLKHEGAHKPTKLRASKAEIEAQEAQTERPEATDESIHEAATAIPAPADGPATIEDGISVRPGDSEVAAAEVAAAKPEDDATEASAKDADADATEAPAKDADADATEAPAKDADAESSEAKAPADDVAAPEADAETPEAPPS